MTFPEKPEALVVHVPALTERSTMPGKPRNAGPKETLWPLDPHTLAKHEILRRYLSAWFPIMSQWNNRLVFLDGFAGPGAYAGGEEGSPLIALKTLIGHAAFKAFGTGTEYIFIFWEADRKRFQSLADTLNDYKESLGGSWPRNVKVFAENQEFNAAAEVILADLVKSGRSLAPTFAFVDPFGITGLPMDLLKRLATFDRVELFVNMIMNTAKRFATSGQIDRSFDELFGTAAYKQAEGLSGRDRITLLHDLYAAQLVEECGFQYVQSFEMINMQGHTSYYLFYGTNHLTGLKRMKDAMWKADPGGGYRFSDRLAGQDVLFEEVVNTKPLADELLRVFAGKTVSIEEIEAYVLEFTPYRETHIRKPVLGPLERAGVITVHRAPRARQFTAGTRIAFP